MKEGTVMDQKEILRFARANGFDGIIHIGSRDGCDIYEPYCLGGPECSLIRAPGRILVQGSSIRLERGK